VVLTKETIVSQAPKTLTMLTYRWSRSAHRDVGRHSTRLSELPVQVSMMNIFSVAMNLTKVSSSTTGPLLEQIQTRVSHKGSGRCESCEDFEHDRCKREQDGAGPLARDRALGRDPNEKCSRDIVSNVN
jgi:hypothetical protein